MKIAMPSLSKDAILDAGVNHFEKIIVGIVLLLALWLAWGGISTMRTGSVNDTLQPDAIVSKAKKALEHIDATPSPPPEKLAEPSDLALAFDTWTLPGDKDLRKPVLSRPLFNELARRTKPDVFAIEELQAVPGVTVLAKAVDPQAVGDRGAKPRFRPPRAAEDPLAGMGPGAADQLDPAESVPHGKIVPYVIVTGLVPYAKQFDEYLERFETASFRDPQRDTPLWSDFLIERADVTDGPTDKWDRMNLKAAAKAVQSEWAGVQPDSLPADFFLTAQEQPGLTDASYAWPLPQLAMEPWGPEAVHPWAVAEWRRMLVAKEPMGRGAGPGMVGIPGSPPIGFGTTRPNEGGSGGSLPPGFGDPSGPGFGIDPASGPQPPGEQGIARLKYKVFRFVDTLVKPGRQYRYRVRVSVWNPNYRVPAQHLAEADLGTAAKLPSPPSNETKPVMVPEATNFLARLTPKELKRDLAEVLVMWPSEKTGNYALHSATLGSGGIVSVHRALDDGAEDRKPARPGKKKEPRTQTIPVGVLVDFIGKQSPPSPAAGDQPAGRRGAKRAPPAEPFEVLVLGEDGDVVHATLAGSEERFALYATTLPADLLGQPTSPNGPSGPPPGPPGKK